MADETGVVEEPLEAEVAIQPELTVLGSIAPMVGLEFIQREFFWCWQRFWDYSREHLCGPGQALALVNVDSHFPAEMRNSGCRRMQGDWIFFLDADMVFLPNVLEEMLKSRAEIIAQHGKCDVLTALYHKRAPPFEPIVSMYNPASKSFDPLLNWPDEPFPVDGCGGGCLLVSREALEDIVIDLNVEPFDWYGALWRLDGEEDRWSAGEDLPHYTGTEDLSFALRCRKKGITIWCDPRIKIGHLQTIPITTKHFDDYRPQLLEEMSRNEALAKARMKRR